MPCGNVILFFAVFFGSLACVLLLVEESPGNVVVAVMIGAVILLPDVMLAWWAVPKVTINGSGITLSIGRFVLQQVRADEIRTVVKVCEGRRWVLYKLKILTTPAEAMEAKGEKRLCRNPVVREELKFRRNKSAFKDICLSEGLPLTEGLWAELTPQRQQLLRQLFPEAAHREAKRYTEPPSLV